MIQIAPASAALAFNPPLPLIEETEIMAVYASKHSYFKIFQLPNAHRLSSIHSRRTMNPLRQIVDEISGKTLSKKPVIALHLGDPTNTGAFPECPTLKEALKETIAQQKYHGYGPAHGFPETRDAVAKHFSLPGASFTKDDVIMTSGGSHAIQLLFEALANPGDNILVPSPGFPLYRTLLRAYAIQVFAPTFAYFSVV